MMLHSKKPTLNSLTERAVCYAWQADQHHDLTIILPQQVFDDYTYWPIRLAWGVCQVIDEISNQVYRSLIWSDVFRQVAYTLCQNEHKEGVRAFSDHPEGITLQGLQFYLDQIKPSYLNYLLDPKTLANALNDWQTLKQWCLFR